MEGRADEVFGALNLKPQLFINEVLNSVDDIMDSAFDFFTLEASTLLKIDQTNRSTDLKKRVDNVRSSVQATLDKRLDMWEKYCLHHCFSVPEGFSLPTENEPMCEIVVDPDDEQLDEEIELLRRRLAQVGSESADLNRQLQKLEKQSALSSYYTSGAKEVLQLYEQNSCHNMCEEMMRTATDLKAGLNQLKLKQVEDNEHSKRLLVDEANKDFSVLESSKGLSDLKTAECEEFLNEVRIT